MIFVDTSAWFAASVPTDRNYLAADAFLSTIDPRLLVTTDYVLAETLTLLRKRGERQRTTEFGKRAWEERLCRIEWVQRDDVLKAWIAFETFRDQKWSFVEKQRFQEPICALTQYMREFSNYFRPPFFRGGAEEISREAARKRQGICQHRR